MGILMLVCVIAEILIIGTLLKRAIAVRKQKLIERADIRVEDYIIKGRG